MASGITPSASQRQAIEAPLGPVLVLAGPGAGKTFCLVERIRFLIENDLCPPARICAFTFTNKAAEEIATRLAREIGPAASLVRRSTIHAFCADVLREFHSAIGVERGFGIADEAYQRSVLSRLRYPARWHTSFLNRVALHRFLGWELHYKDAAVYARYEHFLRSRNILDFDSLVLRTSELLEQPVAGAQLRTRWDYVLVDEFQDLNPVQYAIVRALASEHRNLFAVGDDEQSIYSWAGADPQLFATFSNDFQLSRRVALAENRRCPRVVVHHARALVESNPRIFDEPKPITATRESAFPVRALSFHDDEAERLWLLRDLQADHATSGLPWGEYAILYRKHSLGYELESEFLKAGVPCRLAQGRALADDQVVQYVLAALRVIAQPTDGVTAELFLRAVLPQRLLADVESQAELSDSTVLRELRRVSRTLPKEHDDGRKIRRALYALDNLPALGERHSALGPLIEELLSHRVGVYRSVLEERADELSDPATDDAVVRVAEEIGRAAATSSPIRFDATPELDLVARGMMATAGYRRLMLDRTDATPMATSLGSSERFGEIVTLFKALQLLASRDFTNAFRDFVAVDIETTGRDIQTAEVVEIAAVRVRNGVAVAEYHRLVKPTASIDAAAAAVHGIRAEMLTDAPGFADVWPEIRDFIGNDVLIAHNGYGFDFPVLRRQARSLGDASFPRTYDSLPLARELHPGSRRLVDLAHHFGVDPGASHRALDDTRTLAAVFVALGDKKVERARKAALPHLLDFVGVGLALTPTLRDEDERLLDWSRPFALGKYGEALDWYSRHAPPDLLPVAAVIDKLGGADLMARIRAERGADQRYPVAMARLRKLLDSVPAAGSTLGEQIRAFVDRALLSRHDGIEPDGQRVNLLTLHSTKGLEFSRVYVVGVEDAELLKGTLEQTPAREAEEARRLIYVGMTRAKERLVLTRCQVRRGETTGGYRFLVEMGLPPEEPNELAPPETPAPPVAP